MISRGYLQPWGDSRKQVDVIDVEKRRGFTTGVVNATVVNYAYDPSLLTHDLEDQFQKIESRGIPALVKLRYGHRLETEEKTSVVSFLDMHLDRGRYADQAQVSTSALVLKTGGRMEHENLNLGDRFLLSQSLKDVTRLSSMKLESLPWKVHEAEGLVTGDGAVMLWRKSAGSRIVAVTFPMSPNKLLVIGNDFVPLISEHLNDLMTRKCRRWIVGARGSLNLGWATSDDY
ncbi:DUF4238 domain-containing protein [Arthrobacter sp. MYb213]|uniref:DUF4238 domain-containing protein n=1 Tax=Arthrobacter sp. MYb213 TaxID=1848595 RepID=UPI00257017F7|nr:DUF4238 domain-containing protein [Arthrobacter sp. MYb213]